MHHRLREPPPFRPVSGTRKYPPNMIVAMPPPPPRFRRVAFVSLAGAALAVVLGCAGCSSGATPASPDPRASSLSAAAGSSPSAAAGSSARPLDARPSASTARSLSCPQRVYDSMTEAQRVGQLFLVGLPSDAAPAVTQAISAYHFGSVLLTTTKASTGTLGRAVAGIQALATTPATGGVRFLVAANQEGGEIQQLSGPGFSAMPSALTQGQFSDATVRADADLWGRELRAAGVNLDLAPVMDVVPASKVADNAPIGQLDREFGYYPATNGSHGAAFIEGMAQAGVAATAKHFPGLGQVLGNTDFTAGVTDTVTTPNDPALGSFSSAIGAGVRYVMVAEATYTQIDAAHLAVFSPTVIGLLRQRLGFGGVVVSDDLGQAVQVANVP